MSVCWQTIKMIKSNIHIRACQSPLPVASTFPAGLRSIEMTEETKEQH